MAAHTREGKIWLIRLSKEPANWLCTSLRPVQLSVPPPSDSEYPSQQCTKTFPKDFRNVTGIYTTKSAASWTQTKRSGIYAAGSPHAKNTCRYINNGGYRPTNRLGGRLKIIRILNGDLIRILSSAGVTSLRISLNLLFQSHHLPSYFFTQTRFNAI